jgi:hypothetical protein
MMLKRVSRREEMEMMTMASANVRGTDNHSPCPETRLRPTFTQLGTDRHGTKHCKRLGMAEHAAEHQFPVTDCL